MASLAENIERIRSTAVVGTEVRAAIAEALTQVDSPVQSSISSATAQLSGEINSIYSRLMSVLNSYNNEIDQRIRALEITIEDRTMYVTLDDLGDENYCMNIINASPT